MQLKMRADFQQNTKTVAKADRQSDKKSWVPEKKRGTKTIKKCCFCNRDVDHVDVRLACNWIALNTKSQLEKKERTMGNNDARQQLSRQNLSQAEVVSSERIKNTSNLEISIFFHFPPFFFQRHCTVVHDFKKCAICHVIFLFVLLHSICFDVLPANSVGFGRKIAQSNNSQSNLNFSVDSDFIAIVTCTIEF